MNNPFDELSPDPVAKEAALAWQEEMARGEVAPGVPTRLLETPAGGKMFGVLVCEDPRGKRLVLRACSGLLDNRWDIAGLAPPIFVRTRRERVEREGYPLTGRLNVLCHDISAAFAELREKERALRVTAPAGENSATTEASRPERKEQKKRSKAFAAQKAVILNALLPWRRLLKSAERLRATASRDLMRRIFDTYTVCNARGETKTLRDIFAPNEPPSGTGDCAAPKLLAQAYAQKLTPIAIAEFFYGAPPVSGGRVSQAFYPACKNRCGPLLAFMLEGIDVPAARKFVPPPAPKTDLRIVYEDEWIVAVDKPHGVLSVPGKSDAESILAKLRKGFPRATGPLLVHRLDLDTSGILLAAKDKDTHAALQRQFAAHTIHKRYTALLEKAPSENEGRIDFPIRVDVDDRPRQIRDAVHGKRAVTDWRVIAGNKVALFPLTGRTHQLRVHAAIALSPIKGDRLYGHEAERLFLHAETITFVHPHTQRELTIESPAPF